MGFLRVMEMFAGVGGFRLGLERASDRFKVVWANQWEPEIKEQFAYESYKNNFKDREIINKDISKITDKEIKGIKPNLIVGGFPCQDYSVARSKVGKKGIKGKKGVLFWEIVRVVKVTNPEYVLLENVDRLLNSPNNQRGRDFGIMLKAFSEMGYIVEWRVITASEYGYPQRRKRVFIFAVKEGVNFSEMYTKNTPFKIIYRSGFFAPKFPVRLPLFPLNIKGKDINQDIVKISDTFNFDFKDAGVMIHNKVYTSKVVSIKKYDKVLKDILEEDVEDRYYLNKEEEQRFKYLRSSKRIERETKEGFKYYYTEGKMSETDDVNEPSRTMLTSEGTVNRSTHIIKDKGRKRYLTPKECERLNGFNDGWTKGMKDRYRYYCMGNALVVGLIEKMGERLEEIC